MAGLQSGEGGMMIDSVVWAQYIGPQKLLVTIHDGLGWVSQWFGSGRVVIGHRLTTWNVHIKPHKTINNSRDFSVNDKDISIK